MIIELVWNPLSTSHIYYMGWKSSFMKTPARNQKNSYITQATSQYTWPILYCDIVIEANIYFGDKRIRDIDNYNKLWMDSLQGILYKDDKQVVGLLLYKHYDKENPRITIHTIDIQWIM